MSDSEPPEDVKESISSDFIKVEDPEDDPSSSPEVILVPEPPEDDGYDEQTQQEEIEETEDDFNIPSAEPSYPPYKETTPPPLTDELRGVEDVGTTSLVREPPPTGSPSRPVPKSIHVPKAKGYLSFLNFLSPAVLYIIYWRNVKLSVLSLVMSLTMLVTLYVNTILHTVVLMLLASMVVALVYIVTKIAIDSFYNNPIVNPFQSYLESSLSISEEDAIYVTKIALRKLNCYYKGLLRLVLFHNTLKSLKLMIGLFLISYITNYINIITLLFIDLAAIFTVPVLYEHYQIQIDQTVAMVFNKLMNSYVQIQSRIPFLPKLKSE